jgi:transposase
LLRPKSSKTFSPLDEYYYQATIPSDHLLRKIAASIDFSFVREVLVDQYSENRGRPAEDPELMFKICLLEYLYDLSDVQVIEQIRVNLAYRWFLGLNIDDQLPDDSTISYFRVKRVGLERFQKIFQGIVNQCIQNGIITKSGKRSIIDATHIIADVAIPTWLTLLRQSIKRVLHELETAGASEEARVFLQRLDQLWTELKGKTRDEKLPFVLDFARELTECAEPWFQSNERSNSPLVLLKKVISDRHPQTKDRLISLVDIDARTGHKSDKRKIQGYKDHILIDEETELITAVKVTPANAEDGDQLMDLVNQSIKNGVAQPSELLADKAYWSGKNLRFLHQRGIIGHISRMNTKQQTEGLFSPEDFSFCPDKMELVCPHGQTSTSYREKPGKNGIEFKFTPSQCKNCPLKRQCTRSKTFRNVFISNYYFDLKRARKHYLSDEYKEARKSRWLIERRHADKVRNHGLRRSRYRGLERVGIHSLMSTIASNIKRISKIMLNNPMKDGPGPLTVI